MRDRVIVGRFGKTFKVVRTILQLSALVALMHGSASAATLAYYPNDPDLQDLDHRYVYTWRVTNVNTSIPSGEVVTGAYLFFDNIANWDNNPNKLFMHLLDTAKTTGTQVSGSTVSPGNTSLSTDNAVQRAYRAVDDSTDTVIRDDFAVSSSLSYYSTVSTLVANGTANTALGEWQQTVSGGRVESWAKGTADPLRSFTTTPQDYKYDFTAAQILKLNEYILNGGDLAIALDPDCHFFNDGIALVLTTGPAVLTAVPEPATLTLVAAGLSGLYIRRRRKMRALEQEREQE